MKRTSEELAARPSRHRPWVWTLRVGLALVVLTVLESQIRWHSLARAFAAVNSAAVAAAIAAFCLVPAIEATRWAVALGRYRTPWCRCLRLVFEGSAVAAVTPGQIGGDVYRIAALSRSGVPTTVSAAVAIVIRVTGLAVVVVSLVGGAWITGNEIPFVVAVSRRLPASPYLVGMIAVAGFLAAIVLTSSRTSRSLLTRFARALTTISAAGVAAATVGAAGLVAARVVGVMMLAHASNITLPIGWAILAACGGTLATAAPVTVAGLGIREAAIVGVLLAAGVTYEAGVVVAVLCRLPLLLFAAVGAVLLGTSRRSSPSALEP